MASGILETAGQTFFLLIAVRVFQAGPNSKAALSSGVSLGMILSLGMVALVTHRRWTPSGAAAAVSAVAAAALAVMAAFPSLPNFVACSVVALACLGMVAPLLTQIYEDNYEAADRGQRFSRTLMIRIAVAAVFSEAGGRMLSVDVGNFRWLLAAYAAACALSALCLHRIPSRALPAVESPHPFRALRYVREDRLFRITLICWMLMGFANLMMVPMRVEYLANPRYGLNLSPRVIALVVGVFPNLVRLVMSPLWGYMFDRMNFFALRVVLNLGFAVGIMTFFMSSSLPGLIGGAVFFGISAAGGDVAWTLWVTKFAPPERVADYMAVHTFFTGLRGLVAPLVAFHVVTSISVGALGMLSAALIVVATAILAREIRWEKAGDPDEELVRRATR